MPGKPPLAEHVEGTDTLKATTHERLERGRVRRRGAGNKQIRDTNPTIKRDLDRLLEDSTRGEHPDRDSQFRYLSQTVKAALAAGQPVISVDSKKRELVGNIKAVGREWAPKGEPVEVSTHDFKDKELGHAIPQGIFDPLADEGWVTVGIDHETSKFAVNSSRHDFHGDWDDTVRPSAIE